jgi:ribosome maturation factor RimP
MDLIEKIKEIVEPIINLEGIDLVDIEYKMEHGRWILRIYIDKEGGVTLDDCSNISGEVGEILDVKDIIKNRYILEVSSPGLTRPLKKEEDFKRFKGRLVNIKTFEAVDNRKRFRGELVDFVDKMVIIREEHGEVFKLPFFNISKANLDF